MPRTTPPQRALAALGVLTGALLLAAPAQATFPGANGKIAFQSDRDGSYDIFVGDSAETALNVTATPRADEFAPSFDPSGNRMVFESNRTGKFKLYIANADGTNVHRLTRGPGDDRFGTFCGESTVVFQRGTGGNTEIFRVNTNGKRLRQLTSRVGTDSQPTCRVGGKRIAFVSDRSGNLDIWEMNGRGRGLRNVTRHPAADVDPDYSPSGRQLTFSSTRDGNADVYLMRRIGKRGSVAQLTFTGVPRQNRLPKFTPAFTAGGATRVAQGNVITPGDQNDPFGDDTVVFTSLPGGGPEGLGRVTFPGLQASPIIEIADNATSNSAPAVQPRVRVRTNGPKLFVNGTEGDDHIEIRQEPGRFVVLVNRVEVFAYDRGPAFTTITCITVNGQGGDDTLKARDTEEGDAPILGVKFIGGQGDDKLLGGRGDDDLRGGPGDDFVAGGAGDDTLTGHAGRDILDGQDGDDTLHGGEGRDSVYGGEGNDTMTGGTGSDTLLGENGDDTVDGGRGDDTGSGGHGDDRATGVERARGFEHRS